jgi:RNA ligase (TIGR02306 family)
MNASIQQIKQLHAIEGADRIERAEFEGMAYQCVVKKGLKAGDKVVYFSLDSVLPAAPWSEFLKGHNRIRTIRLKGVLSQGLALSFEDVGLCGEHDVGEDVSDQLGVTHYEKQIPVQLQGEIKGNFPGYVRKTDETNIQTIPKMLDVLRGNSLYATVKCDGTSATFAYHDELHVCSRNLSKKDGDNVYWNAYRKYKIAEVFEKEKDVAIQCEIVGPRIQRNRLNLAEVEIRVFDVYDILKGEYYGYNKLVDFCNRYNLPMVPVVGFYDGDHDMAFWLKEACGVYDGTNNRREGIVVRPIVSFYVKECQQRASFKALNNDYLLKDEE